MFNGLLVGSLPMLSGLSKWNSGFGESSVVFYPKTTGNISGGLPYGLACRYLTQLLLSSHVGPDGVVWLGREEIKVIGSLLLNTLDEGVEISPAEIKTELESFFGMRFRVENCLSGSVVTPVQSSQVGSSVRVFVDSEGVVAKASVLLSTSIFEYVSTKKRCTDLLEVGKVLSCAEISSQAKDLYLICSGMLSCQGDGCTVRLVDIVEALSANHSWLDGATVTSFVTEIKNAFPDIGASMSVVGDSLVIDSSAVSRRSFEVDIEMERRAQNLENKKQLKHSKGLGPIAKAGSSSSDKKGGVLEALIGTPIKTEPVGSGSVVIEPLVEEVSPSETKTTVVTSFAAMNGHAQSEMGQALSVMRGSAEVKKWADSYTNTGIKLAHELSSAYKAATNEKPNVNIIVSSLVSGVREYLKFVEGPQDKLNKIFVLMRCMFEEGVKVSSTANFGAKTFHGQFSCSESLLCGLSIPEAIRRSDLGRDILQVSLSRVLNLPGNNQAPVTAGSLAPMCLAIGMIVGHEAQEVVDKYVVELIGYLIAAQSAYVLLKKQPNLTFDQAFASVISQ